MILQDFYETRCKCKQSYQNLASFSRFAKSLRFFTGTEQKLLAKAAASAFERHLSLNAERGYIL